MTDAQRALVRPGFSTPGLSRIYLMGPLRDEWADPAG